MGEARIVWVTSRAVTHGIERCVRGERFGDGAISVRSPSGGAWSYPDAEHVHDTIEAAQARVKEMVAAKLKSLDKQRAKLERLLREGAKVVDG